MPFRLWCLGSLICDPCDGSDRGGFDARMLLCASERMPAAVLPSERKKRAVISGGLVRSEVDRAYT